jgi:hypothetical protein
MSDPHTPRKQDRALEKALTNKIIDDYFDSSESWLRAILRMCIFSLGHLDGKPVFVVECPNQAVAKRLSRKTHPFRGIVYYLTDNFNTSDGLRSPGGDGYADRTLHDRSLFCYQDHSTGTWRCFDTSTNSWRTLSYPKKPKAPTDG